MSRTDYDLIRQRKADSAAVSVNHRALITRTLTKYPVDYALYRELLQNSADAKAETATVQFFSANKQAYASDLTQIHSVPITKLVFNNDGAEFNNDDWSRLKEIARGNPNETKIGAFGVGFYSVFDLTDEPLVHSGQKIISFHYEGDQLQYHWGKATDSVKGATIDLPYRSPGVLPDLVKFTAFLVQSFSLVHLGKVILKLDDLTLLELTKHSSVPQTQQLPQNLNNKSPNGTLKLVNLTMTPLQMTIEYMNVTQMPPLSLSSGFFNIGKVLVKSLLTKTDDPKDTTKLVCFLRRADATIDVNVSSSFRRKMIETVMKAPPAQSTMSLLSFSQEELQNSDIKPPLSDYIFPSDFNEAKIFIGFPTKQNTAFKSHLALNQVVPTMERTAVDMSNSFVKDWNSELLYMAGMVARCVYENELKALVGSDLQYQLNAASHTVDRFQFGESAPDARVGACIASGFWKCSKTILLATNAGILPSNKARLPGKFGPLLRRLPVLEKNNKNEIFVSHLQKCGYILEATFEDAIADLKHEPVSMRELKSALTWLETNHNTLNGTQSKQFKNALVLKQPSGDLLSLATIVYYQDGYAADTTMPLPPLCISAEIVDLLGKQNVKALGIVALPVLEWALFIVSDQSLLQKHAAELLGVVDRRWHYLHESQRESIIDSLQNRTIIPTNQGLKIPSDAYIFKIPLFPDLPVVSDSVSASRAFLVKIGVRESVDMAFVLEALHNETSGLKWSSQELIDYLVEHEDSLKKDDWLVLSHGDFYRNRKTKSLDRISNLYAPLPELVKLGFPTLDWARPWDPDSAAGKLLKKLQIKMKPDVVELFMMATERKLIPTATKFFIGNYHSQQDFDRLRYANLEIVPSNYTYSRPSDCYIDQEAALFNFAVIAEEYAPYAKRFRVEARPPTHLLLDYMLSHPPQTMAAADPLFGYLSRNFDQFSRNDIARCKSAPFVPVKPSQKLFMKPGELFLKSDETGEIKDLFHFIDPLPSSLPFLLGVGVRQSPSLTEIAHQTVSNPTKVYNLVKNPNKYLELLAKVYYGWKELSRDNALIKLMHTSPFLLAFKHQVTSDDDDSETAVLAKASEISIVDDILIFNKFKKDILTAPQESVLESLYAKLGVAKLTDSLNESCQLGSVVSYSGQEKVQEHIRERLRLFLESSSKQCRLRTKEVQSVTVEFVSFIKIKQQLRQTREIESDLTALIHPSHSKKVLLTPKFDWFHVSQALTKLALEKPDPESVIVLELQLSTDLKTLQAKGYNVDRLLQKNKREIHASVPPPETKPVQQVEPDKLAEPAKQQMMKPSAPPLQAPRDRSHQEDKAVIPSPASRSTRAVVPPNQTNGVPEQLQELRNQPHEPAKPKDPFGRFKSLLSRDRTHQSKPAAPGQEVRPVDTGHALKESIRACQPYNEARVHAPMNVDPPPMPSNSCKENDVKDLRSAVQLSDGMMVFVQNGAAPPTEEMLKYAVQFCDILKRCSAIYECPYDTFCLYIGEESSIAFNYRGSLFFNLQVFAAQTRGSSWKPAVTLDFWYTVMAHELAHNLVGSHGQQHSFYTERYVSGYLARLRGQRLAETAPAIL
ncbi:hypothetical protein B9G98_02609 [Wickerhamiella sorbophila]|uniref:Sacsin/Nov domain-containing protein n=1 Tax=Wickerhamiella sorbophila TaxID=45607 RepID=A0A2T0FJ76_9ASCO|nr:hypothetical protein B9G98_02609 [Wickerhamiella sorbophila]PRT54989.1 hypothetical protein B9G98_02609 [Wickerhamiella sorbophila]